jgi:HK97 gp10 family phage protein
MLSANVSLESIQELFATSEKEIIAVIEAGLSEVADLVKDEAKRSAEFVDKTGNLRRSISKRKSKFTDGGFIVMAKGNHAHLVEFGHVKVLWGRRTNERVPAHPFMRNAKRSGIIKAIEVFRSNK